MLHVFGFVFEPLLASFELSFGLVWTYPRTALGPLGPLGFALYGRGVSPFAYLELWASWHAMLAWLIWFGITLHEISELTSLSYIRVCCSLSMLKSCPLCALILEPLGIHVCLAISCFSCHQFITYGYWFGPIWELSIFGVSPSYHVVACLFHLVCCCILVHLCVPCMFAYPCCS